MDYRWLIDSFITCCSISHLKLNKHDLRLVVDYQRNRGTSVPVYLFRGRKWRGWPLTITFDSKLFFLRKVKSFSVCNRLLLL